MWCCHFVGGACAARATESRSRVSVYDLLVVVVDEKHAHVLQFWAVAEMRLPAEPSSDEWLRTPINFIVHTQGTSSSILRLG